MFSFRLLIIKEQYIMLQSIYQAVNKPQSKELRSKVQSPKLKAQSPTYIRNTIGTVSSPRPRNNGLLRDKLQVIKKHTTQLASQHPNQADIIVQELFDLVAKLGDPHPLETEKRKINPNMATSSTQTDQGSLPTFYQEISVIKQKPSLQYSNKVTQEYLRAREAIYKEIYSDNEQLIRENLHLSEENVDLVDANENLTARCNELARKYAELEKTIEKLHEVGSVYNSNSKVLQDCGSEDAETGRFVFSPRSSNLSNRKGCLSAFKTTAHSSNLFDQMSNGGVWKAGQYQSPLPKVIIHKEYAQQTEIEEMATSMRQKKLELMFFERTITRLTTQNVDRDKLLDKVRQVVCQYLENDPGQLTFENIKEVIDRVYNKKNSQPRLIRRSTSSQAEDIEENYELKECKSESKLSTIKEKFQKKIIRRKF